MLNAVNGCTTFTMYNVQYVPDADIDELMQMTAWQKEMQ